MSNIYIGEQQVARVYHKEQVVHPNPVRDGLVLWYDFMGRTNTDAKRGIAEDLSGNGNDGTLTNFAFEDGSGYEGGGLEFDGVDDAITGPPSSFGGDDFTMEITISSDRYVFGRPLFAKSDRTISVWGAHGFGITNISNPATVYSTFWGDGKNQLISFMSKNVYDKSHLIFMKEGNKIMHYVDGVLTYSRVFQSLQTSLGKDMPLQIASTSSSNVYSARAYNHALTPEEISHNYEVEKGRWSI